MTTSDGFKLPGMIVYPKNFDPTKKYPVHVDIYGGPNSPQVRDRWITPNSSNQWWSENGIIQITVDPRAAGHNGREGLDMIYRQLTVWEVKDFVAWAEWLKALPYVNGDKIGVEGFSFGGTMTSMLLMQAPDKFHYGINTGFKAIYNISENAGLYAEPKVTLLNFSYVSPSIYSGFLLSITPVADGYDKTVDPERQKLLFALKSNALFWVAGAPNFGIEYPFNERWSICADYVAPWSSSFATGLYYQLMMVNAEGRYWFGRKKDSPVMTGFFAGANVGGGYYDFMLNNKRTGIQGEFYIMAGLSAGYSHSISSNDRVRLEYALGFGYMQTRYRKYTWDDFDYVLVAPREQVWKTSIFGPTQAKVSLVWLLYVNKKGGER